jgi:hypothetical protein
MVGTALRAFAHPATAQDSKLPMITIAIATAIRIHHTWTAIAVAPRVAAIPARSFSPAG